MARSPTRIGPGAAAVAAPEHRPHPRGQLGQVDRLRDVVVRSGLQAARAVRVAAPAGENDHRKLRVVPARRRLGAADLSQDVQAGRVRQLQVQQEKVGAPVVALAQRVGRRRSRDRVVAIGGEVVAEKLEGRLVVLADDNDAEGLAGGKGRGGRLRGVAHATDNPAVARHAPSR